jgi:hypothetical protein
MLLQGPEHKRRIPFARTLCQGRCRGFALGFGDADALGDIMCDALYGVLKRLAGVVGAIVLKGVEVLDGVREPSLGTAEVGQPERDL